MFNVRNSLLVVVLLILVAAPIMAEDGKAQGGKVNYSVSKPMVVAGTELKAGEYEVKWQSHSPEVTVEFRLQGRVVATVKGKIENLPKKSDYNSLRVGKDASGRDAIKALMFRDKSVSVVFE